VPSVEETDKSRFLKHDVNLALLSVKKEIRYRTWGSGRGQWEILQMDWEGGLSYQVTLS
jgi:hypothetical protein